jgi:hypothetical protein
VASLPFVTDEFGELLKQSEQTDDTPSCSLPKHWKAGFVYQCYIGSNGLFLLWNMFRYGMTENRGFFLNLKDFHTHPKSRLTPKAAKDASFRWSEPPFRI